MFDVPRVGRMLRLPVPRRVWLDDDAVRQQSLILMSMRNTTQPVRLHAGTGIYHIGSLQELPHTICDPVVPLLVAFHATG